MLKVLAVALLALGATVSPAWAQPKIFIASTGSDANDGSRGSPKRSLQAAHDAVDANGEIVILDTAGYGAVTITKGLGVVVPPGVNGFVTVTTVNGSGITINAGASDLVTLRGLIVEGPGNSGNGILAASVGTLVVEDTTVRNFFNGLGVNSTVDTRLVVRGGAMRNNYYGVYIFDKAPGLTINGLVTDTEFTLNGIALSSRRNFVGSKLHLVATRCAVSASLYYAFYVTGLGADAVADGCTISGNTQVFSVTTNGAIYTRGNNTMFNNPNADNVTPTPLAAQ